MATTRRPLLAGHLRWSIARRTLSNRCCHIKPYSSGSKTLLTRDSSSIRMRGNFSGYLPNKGCILVAKRARTCRFVISSRQNTSSADRRFRLVLYSSHPYQSSASFTTAQLPSASRLHALAHPYQFRPGHSAHPGVSAEAYSGKLRDASPGTA